MRIPVLKTVGCIFSLWLLWWPCRWSWRRFVCIIGHLSRRLVILVGYFMGDSFLAPFGTVNTVKPEPTERRYRCRMIR